MQIWYKKCCNKKIKLWKLKIEFFYKSYGVLATDWFYDGFILTILPPPPQTLTLFGLYLCQ